MTSDPTLCRQVAPSVNSTGASDRGNCNYVKCDDNVLAGRIDPIESPGRV